MELKPRKENGVNVVYPTKKENNSKKIASKILLSALASELPVMYVAVPSYNKSRLTGVGICYASTVSLIISTISLIINKLKLKKLTEGNEEKNIKLKKKIKVDIIIMIISIIVFVIAGFIKK